MTLKQSKLRPTRGHILQPFADYCKNTKREKTPFDAYR